MVRLLSPAESPSGSYDFDPGIYEAELSGYDGPKPSPKFANNDIIILEFVSDEMSYDGNLNQLYSYTMKPGSPLHKAVSALAGHTVDDDEEVDLDDLIGAKVLLTIGENKKTGKNGDPITYPKIEAVSPVRKKAAKPARRPVEPEPEEEDESDDDDLDGTPFKRNR